ncbi:ArsR/SmtB family transcription factor [Halobacteriales archaeon Cl-PHB]
MSLLPSRSEAEPPDDAGPRVIGLDSEEADAVLAALSSETARSLLAAIHDDPSPPSELADRVDTSLQNAQYHLEKLEDAGAIEVVDTAYSAKGREMDVYAPADQPLVVFAGDDEAGSTLRTALSRLLGAIGVLAFASLAVQAVAEGLPLPDLGSGGGGDGADGGAPSGGDGATPTAAPGGEGGAGTATETQLGTATDTATETAAETATSTATGTPQASPTPAPSPTPTEMPTETVGQAADAAGGLPPGLLFFAGGLFAISVVVVGMYVRQG